MADHEKQDIERAIDRARDGVGERIDELDRRLRSSLDVKSAAAEHAPEIIAGGAVIGFLAGFGFPKPLRRAVSIGIPLALIAMKFRKSRANGDGSDYDET
ncbi:MAG TPA: hypothetical protein VF505_00065 [Thermoanaerobaculia bacterium]